PMPTLALVPPETPSVANGAAIYAEKCAPCHGDTGLGDGPQGIQLGVTVPAFGLPEIARPASPAQWYTVVTRGKIERFMPPFASLTDQQRWDVVAYIQTLHTSKEQIQKGKELFEANCAGCSTDYFKNLTNMSEISEVELARIVRLGNDEVKAFGENLSDDEMWAVAAYLRTLSFDTTPLAQATAVPVTQTPAVADAVTPSAEGTPLEGTAQAEVPVEATQVVQEGYGPVSGLIENKTGEDLPEDLVVTLRAYEHDFQNPNAGPVELFSLEGTAASDGTYTFDNVEIPENRIFIAEVTYDGIGVNTEPAFVQAGQTSVDMPPLVLYKVTKDTSVLAVDELDIFFDATNDATYQILALYNFRNASESIVAVTMGTQQEIPFLKFPTGAQGLGYEAVQDSAPFLSIDEGFAMRPNDMPYGILAFSSVPREKEISLSQPVVLPVAVVRIFVPDGMEVEGDLVTPDSPQTIQGAVYQSYLATNLKAGDTLNFKVSGTPKAAAPADASAAPSTNNTLLIAAGGLGIALILAGGWMFLRDRSRTEEEEETEGEEDEEEEFESSEEVMDAIIALDDLHRAKKISDEAYQKRRAELKEILKEMM
ncbi:MAG: cytochrome c, partial [Anaerolineae bacterium]|nr:cytochrome c [Anaerolineae bacterium]